MASIIKSAGVPALSGGVAFNYDDLATKAGDYLQGIRGEAAKLIAAAQKEADQIRKKAQADAQQAAREEAEKSVGKKVSQQVEPALAAIRKLAAELQQARSAWQRQWEGAVVRLAAAMAERILGQQLERQPQLPLKFLKEALELATGSGELRIYLNPLDAQALGGEAEKLIAELSRLATARIVADPTLSRGGCRVETQFGVIDQRFEAQLERLVEELA